MAASDAGHPFIRRISLGLYDTEAVPFVEPARGINRRRLERELLAAVAPCFLLCVVQQRAADAAVLELPVDIELADVPRSLGRLRVHALARFVSRPHGDQSDAKRASDQPQESRRDPEREVCARLHHTYNVPIEFGYAAVLPALRAAWQSNEPQTEGARGLLAAGDRDRLTARLACNQLCDAIQVASDGSADHQALHS